MLSRLHFAFSLGWLCVALIEAAASITRHDWRFGLGTCAAVGAMLLHSRLSDRDPSE